MFIKAFIKIILIDQIVLIVSLILLSELCVYAADIKKNYPTLPRKNAGQKWRIGYIESGSYKDYQASLIATVEGLMKLDWIKSVPIPEPENNEDTDQLWIWLATEIESEYLEFVKDAYWSAKGEEKNFDEELLEKHKAVIIKRFKEQKDIDLMMSLGTMAGKAMATDEHQVPTIIASVSDALTSGIIVSVEDSGYDHILAKIDPTRYDDQVKLFHDIFNFKRLGVVYEDTANGRSIAAIPSIERVAQERGFQIKRCYVSQYSRTDKEGLEELIRCHERLAPQIEAIYITINKNLTPENMKRILAPLYSPSYKIPTFSQGGAVHVENGVLMSMALANFSYVGDFYAKRIAQIFNGADPRELGQVLPSPLNIAINLTTAQKIDWMVPIDVLGAADEIYGYKID